MRTKSTGRKIAQVIYVAVGLIFTFLVYVVAYNSGASTNYFELMKTASEAEDTSEMCRAFSMYNIPFDSEPIYDSKTEENHLVVYNAINQLNLSYYEDGKSTTYGQIQFMYYTFIFNPTFDYTTVNSTMNESGLIFYSGDKTYKFDYVVSETVNADQYSAAPTTPSDSLFHASRDMSTTYQDYNFLFTAVSELFVDGVKTNLDGNAIDGLAVVNNKGEEVISKVNVNLDFSQQFYSDLKEFKTASITYNSAADSADMTFDDAEAYLTNFSLDNFASTYKQGFSKSDIYTTSLIWSSIGIASLFAVCIAILFVLIFFFKRIKDWVFGNHSRRTQRIVPNKPKTQTQAPVKTQFDKVNEVRAEDLAKKRAREEEIRKQGNMIAGVNTQPEESKVVDAEIVEAPEVKEEPKTAEIVEAPEVKEEPKTAETAEAPEVKEESKTADAEATAAPENKEE